MENNNFFLDYAITVSVLSEHILAKDIQRQLKKKYYHQLDKKQQANYLEYILQQTIRMSKNYEGNDFKQFYTFELETHPNINKDKLHLHGTFYQCTKEDIATIKTSLYYLLRVYNEKQKLNSVCINPIYYNRGWTNYMKKDQTIRELELDLEELNNTPKSPIDN